MVSPSAIPPSNFQLTSEELNNTKSSEARYFEPFHRVSGQKPLYSVCVRLENALAKKPQRNNRLKAPY